MTENSHPFPQEDLAFLSTLTDKLLTHRYDDIAELAKEWLLTRNRSSDRRVEVAVWMYYGMSYSAQEKYETAMPLLCTAMELARLIEDRTAFTTAQYSVITAAIASSNYRFALAVIDDFPKDDRMWSDTMVLRGQAYYGLERYDDAVAVLSSTLASQDLSETNHDIALFTRGRSYLFLGRYQEVDEAISELRGRGPDGIMYATELEKAKQRMKRLREATGPSSL